MCQAAEARASAAADGWPHGSAAGTGGGEVAIRLTPARAPSPSGTAAGSNAVRGPGPPQGGAAGKMPLAAGHSRPLCEGRGPAAVPHHC